MRLLLLVLFMLQNVLPVGAFAGSVEQKPLNKFSGKIFSKQSKQIQGRFVETVFVEASEDSDEEVSYNDFVSNNSNSFRSTTNLSIAFIKSNIFLRAHRGHAPPQLPIYKRNCNFRI